MTPGDEMPPESGTELSEEDRRTVRRCLTVLAVLGTGSIIGSMSVLYLANYLPLLLIALSPIGRHLILIAPTVNPVLFVSVATVRRLAFYLPCFILGRTLGDSALDWLEGRFRGAARFVRWLDGIFHRAKYPAVFFLIGPIMSTIAGNSRMSLRVWLPLVAGGLVFRMLVTVLFGELLREPIERLLGWIDEYWVPGTVIIVLSTLAYQWRKRRARSQTSVPVER